MGLLNLGKTKDEGNGQRTRSGIGSWLQFGWIDGRLSSGHPVYPKVAIVDANRLKRRKGR